MTIVPDPSFVPNNYTEKHKLCHIKSVLKMDSNCMSHNEHSSCMIDTSEFSFSCMKLMKKDPAVIFVRIPRKSCQRQILIDFHFDRIPSRIVMSFPL